jgi:hypothetical protein
VQQRAVLFPTKKEPQANKGRGGRVEIEIEIEGLDCAVQSGNLGDNQQSQTRLSRRMGSLGGGWRGLKKDATTTREREREREGKRRAVYEGDGDRRVKKSASDDGKREFADGWCGRIGRERGLRAAGCTATGG